MFWTKCNKLIFENGAPVNCDFSPCPGYGLFAFLIRSLSPNQPTGTPNYCYETCIVRPMKINNGHICYSDGYSGNVINIALHSPDSEGKVGYYKGCSGQWEDCIDWDVQSGDCIDWQTYYQDCQQIRVYQILPCYTDYQYFKEAFFAFCEHEGEPNYPDVWENGGDTLTWQAEQCISTYWQAEGDKYKINVNLNFIKYDWSASWSGIWGWTCNTVWDCWDPETGDGGTYDAPQEGMECWEMEGTDCDYWVFSTSLGDFGTYDPSASYSDQQIIQMINVAISDFCDQVDDLRDDINNWNNTTSTHNELCWSTSYDSGFNWWGEGDSCSPTVFWGAKGKLQLGAKTASNPANATGIKFILKTTHRAYDSNCNYTQTINEQEITLGWNQIYWLDEAQFNRCPEYAECWGGPGVAFADKCSHDEFSYEIKIKCYTF